MRAEIIRTEEGFRHLAGPWGELYHACPGATPFSSWEWTYSWWRHLGRRGNPFILTLRQGRELLGILPLWRHPGLSAGRLGFLGQGVSDYHDLLLLPGEGRGALETLRQTLHRYRGWLALDLQHVPATSLLPGLLSPAQAGEDLLLRGHRQDICQVLPLPGSQEELLRGLKKSFRQNLAYAERRLGREHHLEMVRMSRAELPAALERLFVLHQHRWRARGFPGAFFRPPVRDFHREVAGRFSEAGQLGLFELRADGQTVASLYGFQAPGGFYYYLGGFDNEWASRSVGNVLLGRVIAWAIEEGLPVFDFLRGEEGYKAQWQAERRSNLRLVLSRRRALAPLLFRSAELETLVTEGVKRRLSRWGR